MKSKHIAFLSFVVLGAVLSLTGLNHWMGALLATAEARAVPAVGVDAAGYRDAVDAGDFYRVEGRKVRLLRSLTKVGVRHADGQGEGVRKSLESRGTIRPLTVERELPGEHLLVLRTQSVATLGQLCDTMNELRQHANVMDVVPVFIHGESGLEVIPTGQFVVQLAPLYTVWDLEAINALQGVTIVRPLGGTTDQFVLSMPGATCEELLAAVELYNENPALAWASPNFLCQVARYVMPNDILFRSQWSLNNTQQAGGKHGADVDAALAWTVTTGNSRIVIATIDDGLDLMHNDLRDNVWGNSGEIPGDGLDNDRNGYVDDVHGWNFFRDGNDPNHGASDFHGTLVAGVAAAKGNNNIGVTGMAYGCRVMPVKYAEADGLVYAANVAEAIRYAAGFTRNGLDQWRGADVINISGGFSEFADIASALHDAAVNGRNGKGCPIFCAAGNSGSGWIGPFAIGFGGGSWKDVTLRWEYRKDASGSAGEDTVWLDTVTFPNGWVENFEKGLPYDWSTGGSDAWAGWKTVQEGVAGNHAMHGYDGGNKALRAGAIGDNGYSYVEMTTSFKVPAKGGTLTFWVWSSSEQGNWPTKQGDGLELVITVNKQEARFFTGEYLISGVPEVQPAIAYPASSPDTIAVGSSTNFDYRGDHSCYGPALDFLAPGGGGSLNIWTTARTGTGDTNQDGFADGDYDVWGGTSLASPLAAGVAALMLSAEPNLSSAQIREIMRTTAEKVGPLAYTDGRNDYYGYGRINAYKALNEIPFYTVAGDAYERDNDASGAKIISAGATQNRSILPLGDVDWAKFTLTQVSAVTIATDGPSGSTRMWLYGPDSSTRLLPFPPNLNEGTNGVGWAKIEHASDNPLQPATYYVKIQASGHSTTIADYSLSLTVTPIPDAPQWPSIVGTWILYFPGSPHPNALVFAADGTFVSYADNDFTSHTSQGTWIQFGQLVSWTYDVANRAAYLGALISENEMGGTRSGGTWSAIRSK